MNQAYFQWWLKSIQSTLNAKPPTNKEHAWVAPSMQDYMGIHRTFMNYLSLWSGQPSKAHSNFNWQFLADAVSNYQQIALQWMGTATPFPIDKMEQRIALLEKQATTQSQEIERLRNLVNQGKVQSPEGVSELKRLFEKQGREFHRLTDGFKAFAKEHTDRSDTKK